MHLRMSATVRAAYRTERTAATKSFRADDIARGWSHLERAHIVAQPYPAAHTGSHLAMLHWAITSRDRTEIIGQVIRVLVAAPGTLAGKAPLGNTGRAGIGLRETMPVPDDLQSLTARPG